MSLLNVYSSQAGVIPGDLPNINTQFYPVPFDKYITLHTADLKIQSKYYDYWPEVINLIRPALNYFGIRIVQIGGPNDPLIKECDASYLTLSRAQTAYIQKNALLHLGVDSVCSHIASAFNKKIVALYSHIYYQQSKLHWSKPEDIVVLEPKRENHPCFTSVENPKTVNTIGPEKICAAIFKLLNLDVAINFETKRAGNLYTNKVFEIIPDFFGENPIFESLAPNIRLDLNFNQQCAHTWLQKYKAALISDKPLDLELLEVNKKNIVQILFILKDKETFSLDYLKAAKKKVPRIILAADNEKEISDIREKFFDWTVERKSPPDRSKVEPYVGYKFFSNKMTFSKGQSFPSLAHYKIGKIAAAENFVIDSDEFATDVEHTFIYK